MPRYALKIEYDGSPFCGWQRQKDLPSVQQSIEDALSALDSDVPSIAAAGRTDTGVHAIGQVAHCELSKDFSAFRLSEALNYHLKPEPVTILEAAKVDDEFHARFSARKRHYLFRLLSRRAPMTVDKGSAWHVSHTLNLDEMQVAAAHLVGKHDFTTFRSVHCQAQSPVKTLDMLDITSVEVPYGTEYRFRFSARSFLHNQIRSIVGTLERVGAGSLCPSDMKDALEAKNRATCGPVCPPHGLYLTGVDYPENPFTG